MPLLDKLRKLYGVGPVCSELHIAPSTYYHCQQQRHHPDKRSARAQRDDWLKKEILRVYDGNHQVYGVRKVWRQLLREGIRVARCTVARLMAVMGLAGVLRGKKVRTTVSRKAVAAGDRVNRQFVAERPDQLWVADFTYVSTWQGGVYVAFIDRNLNPQKTKKAPQNGCFFNTPCAPYERKRLLNRITRIDKGYEWWFFAPLPVKWTQLPLCGSQPHTSCRASRSCIRTSSASR